MKNILFAEDNTNDAELTLLAFKESNILNDIIHVTNGEEALDYLNCRGKFEGRTKENPIVSIIDLKMPKVDGIELLRAIKTDEQLKSIPVVILTSSREEIDLVKSYALGVNSYVVKPVDFEKFIQTIKDLGIFWALINETPSGNMK